MTTIKKTASTSSKKLISIICPVYNEEENIERFFTQMSAVTDTIDDRYDVEFIFTDNASKDRSFVILKELAATHKHIRVYRFSRNFGFQKSLLTAYSKARGDCAVEYDCDLQDPPEMLLRFIEEWENGYEIVYGVRKGRQEGAFITSLRKIFYRFINKISKDDLPHDAGDFMLIDRKILDQLATIDDQHAYIRGIIFSLGFNRKGIDYDRNAREHGTSKFRPSDLLRLAVDGIVSQSTFPLRIASFAGLMIAFITLLFSFYFLISRIFFEEQWPPGIALITIITLFSVSLNALFLGIIGEYLGRIYTQVKKRPFTIIAQSLNDDT